MTVKIFHLFSIKTYPVFSSLKLKFTRHGSAFKSLDPDQDPDN
jgi:hypothetical protein